jgi:hypothetical protein
MWCPQVLFLKYAMSVGIFQGSALFFPITLFKDAATIWEIIMIVAPG